MGGRIWSPFGIWYHATKHAVEVLSDVMDFKTRPFGIRTIVVQPGGVATEWGALEQYVGKDPVAVLGLIKIIEVRTWEWHPADSEIDKAMHKYHLDHPSEA